jgi:hypothetical protein
VLLYINGLSLRTIGRLLKVSAAAVLKVINNLDEIWHYLYFFVSAKKQALDGRLIVALLVNSLTMNAAVVIAEPSEKCLTDSNNGA